MGHHYDNVLPVMNPDHLEILILILILSAHPAVLKTKLCQHKCTLSADDARERTTTASLTWKTTVLIRKKMDGLMDGRRFPSSPYACMHRDGDGLDA